MEATSEDAMLISCILWDISLEPMDISLADLAISETLEDILSVFPAISLEATDNSAAERACLLYTSVMSINTISGDNSLNFSTPSLQMCIRDRQSRWPYHPLEKPTSY